MGLRPETKKLLGVGIVPCSRGILLLPCPYMLLSSLEKSSVDGMWMQVSYYVESWVSIVEMDSGCTVGCY